MPLQLPNVKSEEEKLTSLLPFCWTIYNFFILRIICLCNSFASTAQQIHYNDLPNSKLKNSYWKNDNHKVDGNSDQFVVRRLDGEFWGGSSLPLSVNLSDLSWLISL